MLTRSLVVAAIAAVALVGPIELAHADGGGVTCPPNRPVCVVVVTKPGGPGTGGSGGGSGSNGAPVCKNDLTGMVVPCYDPTWGWWSSRDDCYYQRISPPPPATTPEWAGHYPTGAVYSSICPGVTGTGGGWVWFPNPPPGYGGAGLTPAVLAQQAISTMRLQGPAIGMTPSAGKTGLVGLPVWLWTAVSATTWGPSTATAAVPGLSVTAVAHAKRIVWDMGDGHVVTCANPGTQYLESRGAAASPTCGYVYAASSAGQPGSEYVVTATTTWDVTWVGGGESGALTVTRTSTTRVRIGELQVLVS